jgi:hypothetical protein
MLDVESKDERVPSKVAFPPAGHLLHPLSLDFLTRQTSDLDGSLATLPKDISSSLPHREPDLPSRPPRFLLQRPHPTSVNLLLCPLLQTTQITNPDTLSARYPRSATRVPSRTDPASSTSMGGYAGCQGGDNTLGGSVVGARHSARRSSEEAR